jgi:hypothetical protein
MRSPRYTFLGGIALVLLLSACGEDSPLAPSRVPPPDDGPFYPLAIGTRWEFDRGLDVRYFNDADREIFPPYLATGRALREIVAEEVIAGRTYLVEWERFIIDGQPPDTVESWERFRQDSTGLYRAVVDGRVPPGQLPPADSVGEAVLLAYPLEAGATWNRAGITYADMTVEGEETLTVNGKDTPTWRLRIDYRSARPDDFAFDWYARLGLVSSVRHGETNAMDGTTGEVIRIVRHETTYLTGAWLVGRR